MSYAIEMEKLRKEYGKNVAVKDISLQIKEGGIFSLLGVNGAGKTTTIRMLTGLSKPTSGKAYVFGNSITEDLAKVKKLENLSPQETSVAPNLTVRENLTFMARIYGMDKDRAEERVEELISQFSLQEVAKKRAKLLSGGWQRRVSIAMALVNMPRILFLDEPTLGLDVLARREVWKVLEEIKTQTTIVLTTHYMEEAEALSDEVAVMIGGEIKAQGTVEELKEKTDQENLEKAFVEIARASVD